LGEVVLVVVLAAVPVDRVDVRREDDILTLETVNWRQPRWTWRTLGPTITDIPSLRLHTSGADDTTTAPTLPLIVARWHACRPCGVQDDQTRRGASGMMANGCFRPGASQNGVGLSFT